MKIFAFIAVAITGALLIYAESDFPDFGSVDSPANSPESVSGYYLEHNDRDTGVPNVVTSVLADYRGYDTMFETVVIFTAGIAIIGILRLTPLGSDGKGPAPPRSGHPSRQGLHSGSDLIIATTCKMLIPVIQLFGLYVIAHGHHSPGGGFQGGVILGASFILLAISKDLDAALLRMSERRYLVLAVVGILIYAGIGLICMVLGGEFLNYSTLSEILPFLDPVEARYQAMLWVEIGVAFTVAAIMFAIYANLSTAGDLKDGL